VINSGGIFVRLIICGSKRQPHVRETATIGGDANDKLIHLVPPPGQGTSCILPEHAMMKTPLSILVILLASTTILDVPAIGRGGGGGFHGGGMFGGGKFSPSFSMPHNFEHATPPQQPIFGPNRSVGMPQPDSSRRVMAPTNLAAAPTDMSPGHLTLGSSRPAYNFRGLNVHSLDADHRTVWSQGRWHHGYYGGLYGWWWLVAGYWYWYQEPIFPYPDYVSDEIEPDTDDQVPPDANPPDGLEGDVYYYCGDPNGYYPYVATCNAPWETVPATSSP
jgi:hypothetical protein